MAERDASSDPAPRRDTYTPESLLAVAVEVFIDRGYDGTSMEHLSRAAGISKSSIYHHVRGKEELLERAVGRALDGLFGILREPDAVHGRAIDRLEHVVHRTVDVLMSELPYVTLLLRVRGNTRTERWAMERRREFDQRVADLLKAAVTEGDLRSDVDVRLATRLLFGMINSMVEWYRPAAGPAGTPDGATAASDGSDGAGTSTSSTAATPSAPSAPSTSSTPSTAATALSDEVAATVVRIAFDGLRT